MGLLNRLFRRTTDGLTGSLGDLTAILNGMKVSEIKAAIDAGQFDPADVVAAESSATGKKRKGVLALG